LGVKVREFRTAKKMQNVEGRMQKKDAAETARRASHGVSVCLTADQGTEQVRDSRANATARRSHEAAKERGYSDFKESLAGPQRLGRRGKTHSLHL
jgi:hypothetical protein